MSITFTSTLGLGQISTDHSPGVDWINTRNNDAVILDALFSFSSATLTSGSVIYGNASGKLAQDNASLFYDVTNKRLGVGLATPAGSIHGKGTGQTTSAFSTSGNLGGAVIAQDAAGSAGNGGAILFGSSQGYWAALKALLTSGANNTTGDLAISLRAVATDAALTEAVRIYANGGVTVGAPTGGNKGGGTINVATNIYKNNTAYNNPAYALEQWATGRIEKHDAKEGAQGYRRLTLEQVEEFIREHFELPGHREGFGLFDGGDWLLEKLEEAFTHILELHARIKELEARA